MAASWKASSSALDGFPLMSAGRTEDGDDLWVDQDEPEGEADGRSEGSGTSRRAGSADYAMVLIRGKLAGEEGFEPSIP
jgi:hypothetical protein